MLKAYSHNKSMAMDCASGTKGTEGASEGIDYESNGTATISKQC